MGSCFPYKSIIIIQKEKRFHCSVDSSLHIKTSKEEEKTMKLVASEKRKKETLKAYFVIWAYGKHILTTGILLQSNISSAIVHLGLELCSEHLRQKHNMHNRCHDVEILRTWQNTVYFFSPILPSTCSKEPHKSQWHPTSGLPHKTTQTSDRGSTPRPQHENIHTNKHRRIPTAYSHVSLKMTCFRI